MATSGWTQYDPTFDNPEHQWSDFDPEECEQIQGRNGKVYWSFRGVTCGNTSYERNGITYASKPSQQFWWNAVCAAHERGAQGQGKRKAEASFDDNDRAVKRSTLPDASGSHTAMQSQASSRSNSVAQQATTSVDQLEHQAICALIREQAALTITMIEACNNTLRELVRKTDKDNQRTERMQGGECGY
jgi:hypothetical protein